jgi:hypothetical protein
MKQMFMKITLKIIVAASLFLGLNHPWSVCAQGTAFTYQGRVTDNGTNFNGTGQFEFALVTGTNGQQATATANMGGVSPSEFVSTITVNISGSGYSVAPIVTLSGGGGLGATASASVSGGIVTGITVLTPGSGYSSAPTVTIAPPAPDYTTHWSNDGTSVNGSEPSTAVSVAVSQGLFTVILGNTSLANMTAIPTGIFSAETNLQLLIWFNDGVNGFAMLTPPQNLTPAPYAIQALNANSASNLLGALPAVQLSGTVPLAQLPAAVVTNNETTVTLNNLTLDGTLNLPAAPMTINSGGNGLLHADDNNFFAGLDAGVSNTVSTIAPFGWFNTGLGNYALFSNTNGAYNTAVGAGALYSNTSGYSNTGVGRDALYSNTSGHENTAVGLNSLFYNTSGIYNTANGADALLSNTIGVNNTANGTFSLEDNTSGNYNAANGAYALQDNTNGSYNAANGDAALQNNTSGSYNTADGDQALQNNTNGSYNTADGYWALFKNTGGYLNTADGAYTLVNLGIANGAGGTNNIALGFLAGSAFTGNESSNIDIGNNGVPGESSIIRIGSSQSQTFIAGIINGDGNGLTDLNVSKLSGPISLAQLPAAVVTNNEATVTLNNLTLDGTLNLPGVPVRISSGGNSLFYADANNDFFAGPGAGNSANDTGGQNTAEGNAALANNTSGGGNTANGNLALQFNISGSENTADGFGALYENVSGQNNTAVGFEALENLGSDAHGGTNNIALGFLAGNAFDTDESSNIDIGNVGVRGENGVIRIGTEGIQNSTFLVGNVGINEASPSGALHITGPTNAPPDGVGSSDNGLVLGTTGTSGYKWIQSYGGPLVLNGPGNNVGIGNSSPSHLLVVGTGGAYCDGTSWVNGSDRNSKRDFAAISAREVLDKLSAIPITEWQYKVSPDGVRHIGPMAQDFHAAFGLNGGDDKHISTVDEGGVALAAIQGLNEKLETDNAELKQENKLLAKRLDELEAEVQALKP